MRPNELTPIEEYLKTLFTEENEFKKKSRDKAESLSLAGISLSAAEAQLVKTLIRLHQCKKFVEIGTLTGLSAQYIFEALPVGGELWTFEKDPQHGEISNEIFSQLDQSKKKINLMMGDARSELDKIRKSGPFDGIFIDGNKAAYLDYLAWAEANLRSGGLILADNVFLSGAVWDISKNQKFSKNQVAVMREFNRRLSDQKLFESALIATSEGLFVAIKK